MGYPSVFPTGYYIKFRNEYDTYIWNIFKFQTGISNIGCQDSAIVTNTLLVVIIVSFERNEKSDLRKQSSIWNI